MRWGLLGYGLTLGLMNLLIYLAFARIPIGIVMAIEVMGPLAVALFGSRRPRDFVWLMAAIAGLVLLMPPTGAEPRDPVRVAFAAASGVCWATYILTGKHVSEKLGLDAVAWGMLVAAALAVPRIEAREGGTQRPEWGGTRCDDACRLQRGGGARKSISPDWCMLCHLNIKLYD